MQISVMRFLLLISVFLCLNWSCKGPFDGFTKIKRDEADCLADLKPVFSKVLYHADIDVIGKQLTGLLFFKTMPDSSKRVVFYNEMGLTFFDFEWNQDRFIVHYCMDKLNRNSVIKTLRKDFELVLMEGWGSAEPYLYNEKQQWIYPYRNGKEYRYYYADSTCTEISRLVSASKSKKIVEIELEKRINGMPAHILIEHRAVHFVIDLKQLPDNKE